MWLSVRVLAGISYFALVWPHARTERGRSGRFLDGDSGISAQKVVSILPSGSHRGQIPKM